jgi:methylmalonyl-CoA mutase cobalamin-binding subunit
MWKKSFPIMHGTSSQWEGEEVKQRRKIRIMLEKLGLYGHHRGLKALAALPRGHGFEVIYLGLYNTPESLAQSAVQEDVVAIGISWNKLPVRGASRTDTACDE